jgi:hypothetical protein
MSFPLFVFASCYPWNTNSPLFSYTFLLLYFKQGFHSSPCTFRFKYTLTSNSVERHWFPLFIVWPRLYIKRILGKQAFPNTFPLQASRKECETYNGPPAISLLCTLFLSRFLQIRSYTLVTSGTLYNFTLHYIFSRLFTTSHQFLPPYAFFIVNHFPSHALKCHFFKKFEFFF